MNHGLLLASLLSLAGLTVMGAIALVVEPPRVALSDLAQRVGATVTVTATIATIDNRPDGWSRLRLQDANASVDAVSNQRIELSPGDLVDATGQVSTYAARVQLRIESATDIVLRRAWQDHHIPLSRLLAEPWRHAGTHVRTSGILTERHLTTDDEAFSVPVRGGPGIRGAVLVHGLFDYETKRAQLVLIVHEASLLAPAAT